MIIMVIKVGLNVIRAGKMLCLMVFRRLLGELGGLCVYY
jgi:hypothetical protein